MTTREYNAFRKAYPGLQIQHYMAYKGLDTTLRPHIQGSELFQELLDGGVVTLVNDRLKRLFNASEATSEVGIVLARYNELRKQYNLGSALGDATSKSYIEYWLVKGYTPEQMLSVLENVFSTWVGTEYQAYLVPTTIFKKSGDNNFEIRLAKLNTKGAIASASSLFSQALWEE
jgi:uncharacterized phage protein (TIGR02220 family)